MNLGTALRRGSEGGGTREAAALELGPRGRAGLGGGGGRDGRRRGGDLRGADQLALRVEQLERVEDLACLLHGGLPLGGHDGYLIEIPADHVDAGLEGAAATHLRLGLVDCELLAGVALE